MTGARFAVGARVRTRAENPAEGHTRLPGYLCGRRGVVHAVHGVYPVADERASGVAEPARETLYTVLFQGSDVWGAEREEGALSITAEMWDRYLEPDKE
jgi:nitrile hydratase